MLELLQSEHFRKSIALPQVMVRPGCAAMLFAARAAYGGWAPAITPLCCTCGWHPSTPPLPQIAHAGGAAHAAGAVLAALPHQPLQGGRRTAATAATAAGRSWRRDRPASSSAWSWLRGEAGMSACVRPPPGRCKMRLPTGVVPLASQRLHALHPAQRPTTTCAATQRAPTQRRRCQSRRRASLTADIFLASLAPPDFFH
jgi:hypothetical protein